MRRGQVHTSTYSDLLAQFDRRPERCEIAWYAWLSLVSLAIVEDIGLESHPLRLTSRWTQTDALAPRLPARRHQLLQLLEPVEDDLEFGRRVVRLALDHQEAAVSGDVVVAPHVRGPGGKKPLLEEQSG